MNKNKENSSIQKKRKIIQDYDGSSVFYDKRYRSIQYQKYALIINTYPLLLSHRIILDAGCGSGLLFDYLKEHIELLSQISFFSFIGLDISLEMLKKFHSKVKSQDQVPITNFHLLLGDLENLPFRPNIFNVILSLTSYQNLPNLKKAIEETIYSAKNSSDFIISILKKTLNQESFLQMIETYCVEIKYVKDQNNIEDLILKVKIVK